MSITSRPMHSPTWDLELHPPILLVQDLQKQKQKTKKAKCTNLHQHQFHHRELPHNPASGLAIDVFFSALKIQLELVVKEDFE